MADDKTKYLEDQLKCIGCNFRFWGRSELKELANVLLPRETVEHCVNGTYEGGFAMLVATDQRVLLIDKKPMYLTLEDVRFDMVAEVDYNHRLMNSTMFICTPNKSLRFTGYNHLRLRKMFHYIQTRVAEIRQHYTMLQQPEPTQPAASMQQQPAMQATNSQFAQNINLQQPDHPTEQTSDNPDYQSTPEPAAYEAQQLPGPRTYQPSVTQATSYRPISPIVGNYTRLPLMSRQRRFLGSRAMNTSMPSRQ